MLSPFACHTLKEVIGPKHLAKHPPLTDGIGLGIVIAEVKSGNENKPNKFSNKRVVCVA
jgi:hypothetical protein